MGVGVIPFLLWPVASLVPSPPASFHALPPSLVPEPIAPALSPTSSPPSFSPPLLPFPCLFLFAIWLFLPSLADAPTAPVLPYQPSLYGSSRPESFSPPKLSFLAPVRRPGGFPAQPFLFRSPWCAL